MALNPYSALPAGRFWRKAMVNLPPFAIDPKPKSPFRITREDRVATAGSCFAQRVAQALRESGYRYYVIDEPAAGTPREVSAARQFGTFSARYGNLYYARQFVQLFDRVHGTFVPGLKVWARDDGRLVDPFRPTVEPEGFSTEAEVEAAREAHFADVRELFRTLDVFVLTLGLTEGFRHRADGAALPLAPGVAGGSYDPDAYDYVNASVAEVTADLRAFLERLWSVNPTARVIFTVSPVPMIATYEDRHILVSNSYTKSVLRVAAGEAVAGANDPRAVYFPAYDLVTNNITAPRYYAEDQRSINDAGVRHVMRVFLDTFTREGAESGGDGSYIAAETARNANVVCDEEEIERSVA